MIKRTITETIYEYDKEGKLVRKTVTETKEEEDNTTLTYPSHDWWWNSPFVYTNGTGAATTNTQKLNSNDSVLTNTTTISDKITG